MYNDLHNPPKTTAWIRWNRANGYWEEQLANGTWSAYNA